MDSEKNFCLVRGSEKLCLPGGRGVCGLFSVILLSYNVNLMFLFFLGDPSSLSLPLLNQCMSSCICTYCRFCTPYKSASPGILTNSLHLMYYYVTILKKIGSYPSVILPINETPTVYNIL